MVQPDASPVLSPFIAKSSFFPTPSFVASEREVFLGVYYALVYPRTPVKGYLYVTSTSWVYI